MDQINQKIALFILLYGMTQMAPTTFQRLACGAGVVVVGMLTAFNLGQVYAFKRAK